MNAHPTLHVSGEQACRDHRALSGHHCRLSMIDDREPSDQGSASGDVAFRDTPGTGRLVRSAASRKIGQYPSTSPPPSTILDRQLVAAGQNSPRSCLVVVSWAGFPSNRSHAEYPNECNQWRRRVDVGTE